MDAPAPRPQRFCDPASLAYWTGVTTLTSSLNDIRRLLGTIRPLIMRPSASGQEESDDNDEDDSDDDFASYPAYTVNPFRVGK